MDTPDAPTPGPRGPDGLRRSDGPDASDPPDPATGPDRPGAGGGRLGASAGSAGRGLASPDSGPRWWRLGPDLDPLRSGLGTGTDPAGSGSAQAPPALDGPERHRRGPFGSGRGGRGLCHLATGGDDDHELGVVGIGTRIALVQPGIGIVHHAVESGFVELGRLVGVDGGGVQG